jgi:hypothetical protein
VIEHESGRKIAKIALSERRLDRYETALLQADGQSTPDAQTVMGPSAEDYEVDKIVLTTMDSWNQARSSATPAEDAVSAPAAPPGDTLSEEAAPGEPDHLFYLMAITLCRMLGRKITVRGVWDQENTPTSPRPPTRRREGAG